MMRRRAWLAVLLGGLLCWSAAWGAPTPAPFNPPWPELRLTIEPPVAIRDAPRLPLADLSLPPDPPNAPRLTWGAPPLPVPPRPEPPLAAPGRIVCLFLVGPQALIACGKSHLGQGEWAVALGYFERALNASPEPPAAAEAWYWRGEILFRLGREQEARGAFSTSLAVAPQRSDVAGFARLALGWLALEARRAQEAAAELEALSTLAQDDALEAYARFGRAAARALAGQAQSVIPEWDALLARPNLPTTIRDHALLWLADGLRQMGDVGRAAATYERFVAVAPIHPMADGAVAQLGRLHLERGAPLEALKSFRWLAAAFPQTAHLALARAGILLANLALGDWAESRVALRDLVSLHRLERVVIPTLLEAGRVAIDRGEPGVGAAIYESLGLVAPAGPLRTFATFMRAECRRRVGDRAQAVRLFTEVRNARTPADLAAQASYRVAQLAFEAQQDAEARREAFGLLPQAQDPTIREAILFVLGQAAYQLKDYGEALAAFTRMVQEFPDGALSGAARFMRGWAEFRLDRIPEAATSWQRLIEQSPRDPRRPEAFLLLVSIWQRRGDPRQAAKLLFEMIQDHPESPHIPMALYLRGLALLRANDPASAVDALRMLVNRDPLFPRLPTLRLALGQGLLALEKFDDAFTEFRVAAGLLAGESLEAEAWLGAGIAALRAGRFPEAELALQRARGAPSPLIVQEAEYGLALLADHRGDREAFTQAVVSYAERFSRVHFVEELLYLQVGRALEAGDLERARGAVLRMIRAQPQSEYADDALFRIGQAALSQKSHALARDVLVLLVDSYPQSPFRTEARFGAAESLDALGEFGRAQVEHERFLSEAEPGDPRRAQTLLSLARAREATGERIGARRAYEDLLRQFPSGPLAVDAAIGLAQLLIRDRQWDQAQALLTWAIEQGTSDRAAQATYWLGELHRAAGRAAEAADAYLSVVYLYPKEGEWVTRALAAAGDLYRSIQQPREAAIVYRKLLGRSDLPETVAKSAREALAQLEGAPRR